MMDYEAFKALVREMRTAQKDTKEARTHLKIMDPNFAENFDKFAEAEQRSKALEKRVDDELAQKVETDQNVIIMKNGQKLVQGSLF